MHQLSVFESVDFSCLNEEQKIAFFDVHNGSSAWVLGGSSTGKTFFSSILARTLPGTKRLIAHGSCSDFDPIESISSFMGWTNSYTSEEKALRKKAICDVRRLVIDHSCSLRADVVDRIDQELRVHKSNNTPFGGIQIIFLADFCASVPPVRGECIFDQIFMKKYNGRLFAFEADVFQQTALSTHTFSQYYIDCDSEYLESYKAIRLSSFLATKKPERLRSAMDFFSRYSGICNDNTDTAQIICTSSQTESAINARYISNLPGKSALYKAKIKGTVESIPLSRDLEIKKGLRIFFARNIRELNVSYGDMGVIVKTERYGVLIMTDFGHEIFVKPTVMINREFSYKNGNLEQKITGEFTQIPIIPAHAIRLSRTKGKRFSEIKIHSDSFTPAGFLYGCLSKGMPIYISKSHLKYKNKMLDKGFNGALFTIEQAEVSRSQREVRLEKMRLYAYRSGQNYK